MKLEEKLRAVLTPIALRPRAVRMAAVQELTEPVWARLYAAVDRHPLLVLRAASYLIDVGGKTNHASFGSVPAMKLLSRIGYALRAAYPGGRTERVDLPLVAQHLRNQLLTRRLQKGS